MSQELVYTSVPRGLAPNSVGFCTVAATAGMSRQVRTVLESLCAYEVCYGLSDPRAHLNPVNFAHTRISVGGQPFSVLSRVAACGTDYSGRSNNISHHFLLSAGEQLAPGPAWMLTCLRENETFKCQWQGMAQELPEFDIRGAIGSETRPPVSALNWKRVTGDAGWAGALAAAFRRNSDVPAFVIFEPGMDLLLLFEESLALLSPDERWKVGFSTHYSVLPTGCQYHWRGVVAGSKATDEIRRFPNATVIDLTSVLPPAAADEYSEAARTGRSPVKARPVAVAPGVSTGVPAERKTGAMPVLHAVEGTGRRGKTPRVPTLADLSGVSGELGQTIRLELDRNDRRTRKRLLWVGAGILLLVAGLVALLWVLSDQKNSKLNAELLELKLKQAQAEKEQLERKLASRLGNAPPSLPGELNKSAAEATSAQGAQAAIAMTASSSTSATPPFSATSATTVTSATAATTTIPAAASPPHRDTLAFAAEFVGRDKLRAMKQKELSPTQEGSTWRFHIAGHSPYRVVMVPDEIKKHRYDLRFDEDRHKLFFQAPKTGGLGTGSRDILVGTLEPQKNGADLVCNQNSDDKYRTTDEGIIKSLTLEIVAGDKDKDKEVYRCVFRKEVQKPSKVSVGLTANGDLPSPGAYPIEVACPWPEELRMRFSDEPDDHKVATTASGLVQFTWAKKDLDDTKDIIYIAKVEKNYEVIEKQKTDWITNRKAALEWGETAIKTLDSTKPSKTQQNKQGWAEIDLALRKISDVETGIREFERAESSSLEKRRAALGKLQTLLAGKDYVSYATKVDVDALERVIKRQENALDRIQIGSTPGKIILCDPWNLHVAHFDIGDAKQCNEPEGLKKLSEKVLDYEWKQSQNK